MLHRVSDTTGKLEITCFIFFALEKTGLLEPVGLLRTRLVGPWEHWDVLAKK